MFSNLNHSNDKIAIKNGLLLRKKILLKLYNNNQTLQFSPIRHGLEVESSLSMQEVPGSIPGRGNIETISKFQNIFLLSKESEISKFGDGWISDDVITDDWKTLSRGLWKKLFQPSPAFSTPLWKMNRYIRGQRIGFHKQGNTIRKRSKMIDKEFHDNSKLYLH